MNKLENTSNDCLHIILLLDTSGSMFENNKIDILNEAVNDIIKGLKQIKITEIYLSVITFGDKADLYLNSVCINDINDILSFDAKGGSMIAEALKISKSIIEGKNDNYYLPAVILISDGFFYDDWKNEFDSFINDDFISKVQRLSVSIGKVEEAEESLKMFSDNGICYTLSDAENIFMLLTLNKVNDTESGIDSADLISYYKECIL